MGVGRGGGGVGRGSLLITSTLFFKRHHHGLGGAAGNYPLAPSPDQPETKCSSCKPRQSEGWRGKKDKKKTRFSHYFPPQAKENKKMPPFKKEKAAFPLGEQPGKKGTKKQKKDCISLEGINTRRFPMK